MNFNTHYALMGKHAFLSASRHSWIHYNEDDLVAAYTAQYAKERGTQLHELACNCIRLGVTLPKTMRTLNMYVNDGIGYRMTPEVTLAYSENCFGTADTIAFDDNFLRVHDLKTGVIEASMDQLYIYVALFCLEYQYDPREIGKECRIYQSDTIRIEEPNDDEILEIMDKIIRFDKRITEMKLEG